MSDIRLRRTSNRSIPFRPVDRRCLAYVWTLTKNCPETGCRAITKPICIVRKLCVGQVAAIIAALQCANASDLEVHDMRTELQRSRAMLRVLRPYLGNRAYHKENIALRDTARLLTPVRDAKVLVQTAREFRRDDDISAVRQFYGRVVGELTAEWRERQRLQKPISTNSLRKVQHRLECLSAAHWDGTSVCAGPAHAYKLCRKRFRLVQEKMTDGRLHEWRKQVKYFVYQLEALTSKRGDFAIEHQRSSRLAECLGRDHDLSILQGKVVALVKSSKLPRVKRGTNTWTRRISRRRTDLQKEARHIAAQIYAEKPSRFRARIEKAVCYDKSRCA